MQQKTNFFKKFINSIYNLNEFSKYVKEGLGRAILYVFFMALILGGIKGAITGYEFNKQLNKVNQNLQNEENKFTIENGVLNTNNSPLVFEENANLIYMDSNKTLDQSDELRNITVHNDNNILFLKDGILMDTIFENQKVYYKDFITDRKIDNSVLLMQMPFMSKIIISTMFIYTVLMCFISTLINCIFVTAFASFALIFMKILMKYSVLYSLSLYAATLPFIFKTVIEIINPSLYLDTMFIVGTLVYVIFILKYIKSKMLERINSSK